MRMNQRLTIERAGQFIHPTQPQGHKCGNRDDRVYGYRASLTVKGELKAPMNFIVDNHAIHALVTMSYPSADFGDVRAPGQSCELMASKIAQAIVRLAELEGWTVVEVKVSVSGSTPLWESSLTCTLFAVNA